MSYPGFEEKDPKNITNRTVDSALPQFAGESIFNRDYSIAYKDVVKHLRSASAHRMLGHPQKSRKHLDIVQNICEESAIADINLEFTVSVERAALFMYEGNFEQVWNEVNACMYLYKSNPNIDPYLKSAMHSIEAVCLQVNGLRDYSYQALICSRDCLRAAQDTESPYEVYYPFIKLCYARASEPDCTDAQYINMLKQARQGARDLSSERFPEKRIITAFINTIIGEAYLSAGNNSKALKHLEMAEIPAIREDSNLRLSIMLTKARIHISEDQTELALKEFSKTRQLLPDVTELSKQELHNYLKSVFDIYYPGHCFSEIVDSVRVSGDKSVSLYNQELRLNPYQMAKYAQSLFYCGKAGQAFSLYQQAADLCETAGCHDSELIFKLHQQAFKCAFISGDIRAIEEHSYKSLEEAKKFSSSKNPYQYLAMAMYAVSVAAYVNSRPQEAISYTKMALGVIPDDDSYPEIMADLFNMRAIIASDIGCYGIAIEDYKRVLKIKKNAGDGRSESYAGILNNLAEAYLKEGNIPECFKTVERLSDFIDANRDLGLTKKEVLAYQGLVLLHRGIDLVQAEQLLQRANAAYYKLHSPDDLQIAEVNKWLGDLRYKQAQKDQALNYYAEAERIYAKDSKINLDRLHVNQKLVSLYIASNDMESALKHQEICMELISETDSIREKYFS